MSVASLSSLWREAFDTRRNDVHATPRARLLQALERMRENVATLITTVPGDCKDLTVHDVTHLDALWEMASLLAGDGYQINPAEAFVLGGAILLHDAGLSSAAFPGGLSELKSAPEWADIAAATLRQNNLAPSSEAVDNPPAELLTEIKFGVIRVLHAQQAEKMATASWKLPNSDALYLIEDVELRQAFGSAIGRVAHSHHWDIERVADVLLDNIGAGTVLPAEWSVSERKTACLLRCADAAHIDRRRAPSILFSALKPASISAVHWGAQNKLNKPTVDGSALIYSAGQPFRDTEADAWWLAYDLVRLVDKEVRSANGLLEELGFSPLRVRRVVGAESPRALSVHIRPDGWRPIDAEVRVSDPVHLARTLGGRNLYGRDPLAPVRELLQNAADAIRARRQLEDREASWGAISITIEADADSDTSCWLHIDDNGIGMTERVLAGPLIDFGRSIWTSPLLREEFPGLQSKQIQPIGKFGIGFFSVFELSNHVKVASKHYAAALSDAKVLEFRTLSSRPLVRPSQTRELPRDVSTRVSLRVDNKRRVTGTYQRSEYSLRYPENRRPVSFQDAVMRLVAFLDIDVSFLDRINGTSFKHSSAIYETDPADFIDELLPSLAERERETIKTAHSSLLRPLRDDSGNYGRAALGVVSADGRVDRGLDHGSLSVGGFTYPGDSGVTIPFIGVIEGYTEEASRRSASSTLPDGVVARWATEQASLINQGKFLKSDLLRAAEYVIEAGGDPGPLPYCFSLGGLKTYAESKNIIQGLQLTRIVLKAEQYQSRFRIVGHNEIGSNFFELPLEAGVFVLRRNVDKIVDDEIARLILKEGKREITLDDLVQDLGPLRIFLDTAKEVWASEPRLSIEVAQIFDADLYSPPAPRWVLSLRRP